eukprot:c35449_g1_i1 orf=1-243(-)
MSPFWGDTALGYTLRPQIKLYLQTRGSMQVDLEDQVFARQEAETMGGAQVKRRAGAERVRRRGVKKKQRQYKCVEELRVLH